MTAGLVIPSEVEEPLTIAGWITRDVSTPLDMTTGRVRTIVAGKDSLVFVAAVYDRRTNHATLAERRYRRSTAEAAGDVILEMRDGGALPRDDPFHQVADGNDADDLSPSITGKCRMRFSVMSRRQVSTGSCGGSRKVRST